MADEITPRFNLVKPEVGGSADTWGDKWNENADKIDANALNRQTDLARYGGTIPETNRLNVWEADQQLANERAILSRPSDDSSLAARGGMMWESTDGAPQFRVSYQHGGERLLFFGYGSGGSNLVGAVHRDGAWVIGDGSLPAVQGPGTLNAKNGLYDGGERVYSPKNIAQLISDANLVQTSRTISAGTGLTGGGDLSANRTISLASSHTPIGVGQTWQNVTGSRATNTNYTNTTGRPIMVYVSIFASGLTTISIGGQSMPISSDDKPVYASFIVPAGATYYINTTGTVNINRWFELR